MRIYYRDDGICITSSAVWVRGTRYRLCDVDRTWRTGRLNIGRRVTGAGAVLAGVVVARIAVTQVGWLTAGGVLVLLAAAVGLGRLLVGLAGGAMALQALEDLRRYSHWQELWASVAGRPVRLLGTEDAIRYGQVRRALIRALDDQRRTAFT
ncbi:hypothetical protein K1W54_19420 [Micromonospora sp. CPCC 205371]|nr:hypothetical protein [Micromonospora sp. CPCC 205371]